MRASRPWSAHASPFVDRAPTLTMAVLSLLEALHVPRPPLLPRSRGPDGRRDRSRRDARRPAAPSLGRRRARLGRGARALQSLARPHPPVELLHLVPPEAGARRDRRVPQEARREPVLARRGDLRAQRRASPGEGEGHDRALLRREGRGDRARPEHDDGPVAALQRRADHARPGDPGDRARPLRAPRGDPARDGEERRQLPEDRAPRALRAGERGRDGRAAAPGDHAEDARGGTHLGPLEHRAAAAGPRLWPRWSRPPTRAAPRPTAAC